jgi:hypothetical protein
VVKFVIVAWAAYDEVHDKMTNVTNVTMPRLFVTSVAYDAYDEAYDDV